MPQNLLYILRGCFKNFQQTKIFLHHSFYLSRCWQMKFLYILTSPCNLKGLQWLFHLCVGRWEDDHMILIMRIMQLFTKIKLFRICLLLLSIKRKVHEISICIHFSINIYRWHYYPNENEQFGLFEKWQIAWMCEGFVVKRFVADFFTCRKIFFH